MRLRGLVFERLATFERAEVNFCDETGAPLDAIVLVGESAAGKTMLLRTIAAILAEAAGAASELDASDVRRGAEDARCRVVLDEAIDGQRVIVTLEKELPREGWSRLKGLPAASFERWRTALATSAPNAAFAVAPKDDGDEDEGDEDDGDDDTGDPLVAWVAAAPRERVAPVLDRVLWPYRFERVEDGVLYFETPTGEARATELGEAFESVLVMTLELLRLSHDRAGAELAYVIDDVDKHLHPRWQSRILGDFRRAFPTVQIIASTHSPYVVASVDPSQVFRIEDGVVTRVSERVQKGSAVASVMDAAFGAPDLPGPRWTSAPPRALRSEVIGALLPDLGRGSVVYVLPEPLHARSAVDAFGEPALPNADAVTGWLFFIDREPGVPWGHPCEYVFRAPDGTLTRRRAIWPPAGIDKFVPIFWS
ncbi:MAG: AAA family ATPase [Labilithrix sp.]|nr:AAA family ATPase [Labilithrix sp.]MCW5814764.1 AAA family ATPase [Labilithrix sp.]